MRAISLRHQHYILEYPLASFKGSEAIISKLREFDIKLEEDPHDLDNQLIAIVFINNEDKVLFKKYENLDDISVFVDVKTHHKVLILTQLEIKLEKKANWVNKNILLDKEDT